MKQNPMISQVNTINVSLLIYRISWKIERKRIYSLITKCQILNKYIFRSLTIYLNGVTSVDQLHKFMLERVLHTKEERDLLDYMLEMELSEILNHQMIIEVLELVYEGKLATEDNSLFLLTTLESFIETSMFDSKCIQHKLKSNIASFGFASQERK